MKNRANASDRSDNEILRATDNATRVSHKIVRKLQDIIGRGELKPGALLPSERELASRFRVSRGSVREALSILETLRLVEIEPGRRARVLGQAVEHDRRLTRWRYASRFNEKDVYELRLILEPRAACQAAERITPKILAELTANVAMMKDNIRQVDLLAASHDDFKFHDIIMNLSGNLLFKEIHNLNREAILESQRLPLSRHKRLWEPVQEHERVLKALEQRDPDGASYLMQLHIIRAADRVGIILKH